MRDPARHPHQQLADYPDLAAGLNGARREDLMFKLIGELPLAQADKMISQWRRAGHDPDVIAHLTAVLDMRAAAERARAGR